MGDPACWLDQICPACGAMLGVSDTSLSRVTCWRCDAQVRFGDEGPEVVKPGH